MHGVSVLTDPKDEQGVHHLSFSPDGRYLATGRQNGDIMVTFLLFRLSL